MVEELNNHTLKRLSKINLLDGSFIFIVN